MSEVARCLVRPVRSGFEQFEPRVEVPFPRIPLLLKFSGVFYRLLRLFIRYSECFIGVLVNLTRSKMSEESSADRNVEIWKIKKLIKSLEMARG